VWLEKALHTFSHSLAFASGLGNILDTRGTDSRGIGIPAAFRGCTRRLVTIFSRHVAAISLLRARTLRGGCEFSASSLRFLTTRVLGLTLFLSRTSLSRTLSVGLLPFLPGSLLPFCLSCNFDGDVADEKLL